MGNKYWFRRHNGKYNPASVEAILVMLGYALVLILPLTLFNQHLGFWAVVAWYIVCSAGLVIVVYVKTPRDSK